MSAAFKLKAGESLGPTEVGGSFIVATLKERKEPDLADFEKRKVELMREYDRAKWGSTMTEWAHTACVDAQAAGKIKVNQSVMQYEPSARNPEKLLASVKYEPCRDKPI